MASALGNVCCRELGPNMAHVAKQSGPHQASPASPAQVLYRRTMFLARWTGRKLRGTMGRKVEVERVGRRPSAIVPDLFILVDSVGVQATRSGATVVLGGIRRRYRDCEDSRTSMC